jgi:hypothetical protein
MNHSANSTPLQLPGSRLTGSREGWFSPFSRFLPASLYRGRQEPGREPTQLKSLEEVGSNREATGKVKMQPKGDGKAAMQLVAQIPEWSLYKDRLEPAGV